MAWALLCVHSVVDGALQVDWIGKFKSEYIDGKYNPLWFGVLSCHSIVNGAGITALMYMVGCPHLWYLGVLEAIHHFSTDYASTHKWISFRLDQIHHLLAKLVWLLVWWMV